MNKHLLGSVVRWCLWAVATAVIAWYVARQTVTTQDDVGLLEPVGTVGVQQRQTTQLSEQTIASVVSANGMIIPAPDGNGWIIEAPAPTDALAYQLLDPPVEVRAAIDGGPSGFECKWIGLAYDDAGDMQGVVSKASALPAGTSNVQLQCKVPSEVRAAAGMTAVMVLQMTKMQTVTALPLTAVSGTNGQGLVVVVDADGNTEQRTVELGISDNYNIEILGGLSTDERVLTNPVQQDFSQADSGS